MDALLLRKNRTGKLMAFPMCLVLAGVIEMPRASLVRFEASEVSMRMFRSNCYAHSLTGSTSLISVANVSCKRCCVRTSPGQLAYRKPGILVEYHFT